MHWENYLNKNIFITASDKDSEIVITDMNIFNEKKNIGFLLNNTNVYEKNEDIKSFLICKNSTNQLES